MQATNEAAATLALQEAMLAAPANTRSPPRAARALQLSAASCFVAMCAGLTAFAIYLIGFYGRAAVEGRPDKWNDVLQVGYVPGDTAGNLVLASHLAFGFLVTFAGMLQVLPTVRNRWPRFHRWNGRIFATAAATASAGGVYMIWFRGAAGDIYQHLAISLNALLILVCTAFAWRLARKRRFDAHRHWALRLFLAANGGWFFRIGLMLWIVLNQGPAGFDPKTFTGPFLTALAFAQYVLPLSLLELYFHARASRSPGVQWVAAGTLGFTTLIVFAGSAAAAAMLWWPRL